MTIFQIVISILAALILLVYSIALFQVWRLTGRRIKRERTSWTMRHDFGVPNDAHLDNRYIPRGLPLARRPRLFAA